MKVKNDLGLCFNQDIPIILHLIDSLVKPILLYASDFWGCLKLPENNPIENLHMMMCKQILGVQKQTTNLGVLLEIGRTPLRLCAAKFSVKNWERIRLGSGNEILIDSYKVGDICWDLSIKSLLETNGMLNFYVDNPITEFPFIYKKLYQRLYDGFHESSFGAIRENSSKLRTYALFKEEPGIEKYLIEIKNIAIRQQVTKFRLSNHKIAIESDRYEGLEPDERFCPFCPNTIEDEAHFLFHCPVFSHLRNRDLEPYTSSIVDFEYFPDIFKLKTIMLDMKYDTCKFIADAADLRNFLVSKPKTFG